MCCVFYVCCPLAKQFVLKDFFLPPVSLPPSLLPFPSLKNLMIFSFCYWYWCYYPHTLSDSVSPVCGIEALMMCFFHSASGSVHPNAALPVCPPAN